MTGASMISSRQKAQMPEGGMLTTGNQLSAARALIGIDQIELAKAANVSVNTVRSLEACGANQLKGRLQTTLAIQIALENLGIEFTNHRNPGVRVR